MGGSTVHEPRTQVGLIGCYEVSSRILRCEGSHLLLGKSRLKVLKLGTPLRTVALSGADLASTKVRSRTFVVFVSIHLWRLIPLLVGALILLLVVVAPVGVVVSLLNNIGRNWS